MARYEVVVHLTCEVECTSAEEAAAIVRRQMFPVPLAAERLLHLADWSGDQALPASPLTPVVRQHLLAFFTTLTQCAGEAEEAFRDRVEAILLASPVPRE